MHNKKEGILVTVMREIKVLKVPHQLCTDNLPDMLVISSVCLCTFYGYDSNIAPKGKGTRACIFDLDTVVVDEGLEESDG